MNFVADFDINGLIDFVWVFENLKKDGKKLTSMENKWKADDTMENKWKVNNCGLLDTMESNFDDLDFSNATDISNNSKGILRLYIYNESTKKYRYEYYFVKILKNRYFGTSHHHTFKMEVLQVLKGNYRQVGDIINKNGKMLYKNYFEIKKANAYYRYIKHTKKFENLMASCV